MYFYLSNFTNRPSVVSECMQLNNKAVRETVHAHICACYSPMCHLAHICEYNNWKFEDIWKKTVGENSSFYILLRN